MLFGPPARRPFAVRLWDGTSDGPVGREARFTLVLRRPGALRRMLLPPSELAICQAYLRDDFDVEGDLEEATEVADALIGRLARPAVPARLLPRLLALPTDDLRLDAAGRKVDPSVSFHYNVSADFYGLWLDRRLMYSCAYFPDGPPDVEDIDAAQEAKLEHVCRKLRLRPGEYLLDIGCGWGGLMEFAAERYGVRALGITLSPEQAEVANRRFAAAGLADRCRAVIRDYRELPREPTFDKAVSLEMYEHVGPARLPTYFTAVDRATKPDALFLIQGTFAIVPEGWARRLFWRQGQFLMRYIFPGLPHSKLLPVGELVRVGEQNGWEARDLESLRDHYILTIRQWLRRLESRHADAVALAGESIYRVWRLYLATCARGFVLRRMGEAQVLFSKGDAGGPGRLPFSRADIYRPTRVAVSTPGVG